MKLDPGCGLRESAGLLGAHFLEHLDRPAWIGCVGERYRAMKSGAKAPFIAPYWSRVGGAQDLSRASVMMATPPRITAMPTISSACTRSFASSAPISTATGGLT